MIEYLQILGQEVYKIVFLLVPILVSVAMIVWLDRRVWGLVQKRRGPNLAVSYTHLTLPTRDDV